MASRELLRMQTRRDDVRQDYEEGYKHVLDKWATILASTADIVGQDPTTTSESFAHDLTALTSLAREHATTTSITLMKQRLDGGGDITAQERFDLIKELIAGPMDDELLGALRRAVGLDG